MTKARNISDLLDANGDVKSGALDNVPPSNDASALTTGTIDNARISLDANEIPSLDTAKITTGTFADARMPSTALNSNVDLTNLSASNMTSGTLPDARFPSTLPAVSGANLTNLPGGGSMVLLNRTVIGTPFSAGNVASVVFTGFTSTSNYDNYLIQLKDIVTYNVGTLYLAQSGDGGSTYPTGYEGQATRFSSTSSTLSADNYTNQTAHPVAFNTSSGSSTTRGCSGNINVMGLRDNSSYTLFLSHTTSYTNAGKIENNLVSSQGANTDGCTTLKLYSSAGNLKQGTVALYGIKIS
jgi:hypothetical protein